MEDAQPVLRCGQCNKPFDKPATLKRHGYYCRSRRHGTTIRSRSCNSCAKAKARCDNRQPECSRCMARTIECHYPTNKATITVPRLQGTNNATNEQKQKEAPSAATDSLNVVEREATSEDTGFALDNIPLALPDSDFANIGDENLDWNSIDINFADFVNPPAIDETAEYALARSPPMFRRSTPSREKSTLVHKAVSSPSLLKPALSTYGVRSLVPRPRLKTDVQRITTVIFSTLKSYPFMMLRPDSLPPFIHPCLMAADVDNYMEPLTNCISLIHMISSGVRGSRKLFWKNVRLECERFYEEYPKFNKWELLAAMQALIIYIVIRLDEGATENNDNNIDFLLISSVAVTAQQLSCIDVATDTRSAHSSSGLEVSWKDWIFEESRRRLCVIYRVINMLVYFEPSAMCDSHETGLVIAPLPAKKQLWEAGDKEVWKAESEREPEVQMDFGMAANGELVKLDEGQSNCRDALSLPKAVNYSASSRSTADWAEWYSARDGLGGLVMLAASMMA